MDPWRQQILADIGIATWIPRDQLDSLALVPLDFDPLAEPSRAPVPQAGHTRDRAGALDPSGRAGARAVPDQRSRDSTAGNALAALSQSLEAGSPGRARPEPTAAGSAANQSRNQARETTQPVRYPEVACLWCGDVVLFCPPGELHGQLRLVKDILASAANNWTKAAEQVVFRWAELQASGFDSSEADRALLAFAEKRIEVSSARWVLSTPTLQPLLAQLALPVNARLLGLAELADLARQASLKQALWQTLQEHGPQMPRSEG